MSGTISDAQRLLAARLDDMIGQSARGELVCGNFLSPADAAFLKRLATERGIMGSLFLFGGYDGAERQIPVILPEYVSGYDGNASQKAREFFPEEISEAVRAIRIKGSGYRSLSHRDYLGSLLALGIERDRLGDIVIENEHEAAVFCSGSVREYLLTSLDRIASDKVKVTEFIPDAEYRAKRDFLPISDTVASERLDCVVAALTNLSREKAQSAIRGGLCELDYTVEERCDREIIPPCIISVRGHGKYNILSFDGETRRGRLRLVAQKYV